MSSFFLNAAKHSKGIRFFFFLVVVVEVDDFDDESDVRR
jgi:hypothetical protein